MFERGAKLHNMAITAPCSIPKAKLIRDYWASHVVRPGSVSNGAPKFGVPEDPVTGSANACIGRYLAETGLIEKTGREYRSSQGDEMGREGRLVISVSEDGSSGQVGGRAVTSVDGTISV